jgi:exopolysaccharide production protein ExoQ
MNLHTIQHVPRLQPEYSDEARSTGRLWLAIAVVGIGLMVAYSDPNLLTIDDWDGGIYHVDEAVGKLESGSTTTKLAVLSLGFFGVYFTFCRGGWSRSWNNALILTALALIGWAGLSLTWSTEPSLTARRYISLLCICAAGVGLTRQLTPRELVHLVVAVTCLWIGVGLAAELATGKLRPWEPEYRFSGMLHPNRQGLYGALLVLGALAELSLTPRYRRLWILLGLVGMGVLFISKSRTSAGALIAVLFLLCVLKPDRKRIMGAIAAGTALCLAIAVGQFLGSQSDDLLEGLVSMGRSDDTEALTGRLPLWTELTYFVADRPILGHGYGAFWTTERTEYISGILFWAVPSAHSAYFEAMLDMGVIGLVLLVLLLLQAIVRSASTYRHTGTAASGFLFALIVILTIGSFTESELMQGSVICLLGICAVLQIGGQDLTESVAVEREQLTVWGNGITTSGRAY